MKTILNQDEKIAKEGGGNFLKNGVGIGGKLYLTNQRIIFEAHKFNFDSIDIISIKLPDIQSLEKSWSKIFARIPIINNVLTIFCNRDEETYQFTVFGRDAWILSIEAMQIGSTKNHLKELDTMNTPTGQEKIDDKIVRQQDDPEILKKLQSYEEHTNVFCIMCGYSGLMGIESKHIPWYLTWWVLIPLILTGVGIIAAIALGVWRASSEKYSLKCPNCDESLISQ